jgi:hypothetical protein
MILLSNPARLNADQLYGLADMISPKNAETSYRALRSLLDWWMKRAIKAQATGVRPPVVIEEEGLALDQWEMLGGLETSMQLWEKLTALLALSDNPANLDKRQLVIAAFSEIQKAAIRP